ncbi:Rossmann-fold NAD(P)-binding domain-containing protein [Gephyromycinifex aptenodytis]|uniref:SDR family NAD(P)-dependent oxidoreductase n=1 Tax=Gephyromycinifex aptenodytis TaxID=2716227 RepID=UPI0014478FB6|nr:SDR family NAD(P)-dependent oxidoreductase [Gephyromycinifex aptenodytis]
MPTRPDTLLVGCGDLGARIGLRLAARGRTVLALRRRAHLVPAPLLARAVDLTREIPQLPPGDFTQLVVVLTAGARDPQAYRQVYVEGMRRALDGLARSGALPHHAVLVSSSAACSGEGEITEESPSHPRSATGAVLLEAEELFQERLPHGSVIRFAGLYGPDRSWVTDAVRAGRWGEHRWVNLIHREDAAEAVVHLLERESPEPLYLGVDTEPAPSSEVLSYAANLLRLPGPPEPSTPISGKRLSSARLRATGFTFTYPTYREGLRNCGEHRPARG